MDSWQQSVPEGMATKSEHLAVSDQPLFSNSYNNSMISDNVTKAHSNRNQMKINTVITSRGVVASQLVHAHLQHNWQFFLPRLTILLWHKLQKNNFVVASIARSGIKFYLPPRLLQHGRWFFVFFMCLGVLQ